MTDRLQGVLLGIALFTLELLPFYLCLLIAGGIGAGDINLVPLPFTYLLVVGAAFALLAFALRERPLALTLFAGLVVGAVALLFAVRVSPGAYGGIVEGPLDTQWIGALVQDVLTVSSRLEALVLLPMVVILIGWRGLVIGRSTPEFDDVLDRFKVSVVVLVLAAVVSVAIGAHVRSQLAGPLLLILPVTIFAGLLAAALSRAAMDRDDLKGPDARSAGESRWLAMAIVLSLLVVLTTLVLGSILSFGSVGGALAQAGPIGQAIDTALNWIAGGIVAVMTLIFNAFFALLAPIFKLNLQPLPPSPVAVSPIPGATAQVHHSEVTIISLIVLVVLLLLGLNWLRRLFVNRQAAQTDAIVEERESLNGGSLFMAQLRGLFARKQRQPKEIEEALPAGSIRALYRDLLRAAARRGVGRATAETADEFGARLSRSFAGSVLPEDVATLGEAYDAARYGGQEEPRSARHDLQERVRRVLAALRHERTG